MPAHSASFDNGWRRGFRSSDPGETLSRVSLALAPHEMTLKSARAMATRLSLIDLGEVQIVDLSYGTDVWIDPAHVEDSYLVHTALSGSSMMLDCAQSCTVRPGAMHVTSPGARLRVEMTHRCRHLTVRLSKNVFDGYLRQELGISSSRPLSFDSTGLDHRMLPQAWSQLAKHITDQAGAVPQLFASGRLQRHYASMMVELLLSHHPNSYSELIATQGNETAPWHVQRARAIIHEDFDENLSIAKIAMRIGVSVRSLQNGFKRFLGMTPVEYLRHHRLEKLHEALSCGDGSERITDLMLNCGIVDFGRYAHHYRRRYGRSPSEMLRTMRLG